LSPVVRETSLVGYWDFNEGVGTTVIDHSGHNNTGIFVGSPTWSAATSGEEYLSFDGVDDRVDCTAGTSLNITNAITLSIWVQFLGTTSTYYNVINKSNAWTNNLAIRGSDGFTIWYINGVKNWTIGAWSGLLINGNWHHIVAKYDANGGSNNMLFYIDGVLKGNTTATGNLSNSANDVLIGYNLGIPTQGPIDDVRIYNRALAADEIMGLYNSKKGRYQ